MSMDVTHHGLRIACGLGAALTICVAACGESSPAGSSSAGSSAGSAGVNIGTPTVQVSATDQQAFTPASVTAHVGDVVQWTNTGTIMHTITFDNFSSLSDVALNAGGTWEVKFSAAGTYAYHCTIHTAMTGTIVVS